MATIGELLRSEARWDAAAATKSPKQLAREFAALIGVLGYDRKEYDRLARLVNDRLWARQKTFTDADGLSFLFMRSLDSRLREKGWERVDWLGIG